MWFNVKMGAPEKYSVSFEVTRGHFSTFRSWQAAACACVLVDCYVTPAPPAEPSRAEAWTRSPPPTGFLSFLQLKPRRNSRLWHKGARMDSPRVAPDLRRTAAASSADIIEQSLTCICAAVGSIYMRHRSLSSSYPAVMGAQSSQ